ncbi:hypothetical protein [Capnocytophaga haemolytica]
MRKITLLLCLASAVAFGQHGNNGWKNAKLNGKVKTFRVSGNAFNEDGQPEENSDYTYTEFNNKGLVTKMEVQTGRSFITYKDIFDKKGNRIETQSKDRSGVVLSTNKYAYDDRGNRIKYEVLTSDGKVFMQRNYKFDDKNRVTEREACVGGLCDEKITYVYDNNGYLTEESKFDKGMLISKTVYTNNPKGQAVERLVYDLNDKLKQKVVVVFDANGNEVEESTYDPEGVLLEKKTTIYVYDKAKNWTKKTAYVDGKPVLETKQEFSYYK